MVTILIDPYVARFCAIMIIAVAMPSSFRFLPFAGFSCKFEASDPYQDAGLLAARIIFRGTFLQGSYGPQAECDISAPGFGVRSRRDQVWHLVSDSKV